jgi:hypothetical protein
MADDLAAERFVVFDEEDRLGHDSSAVSVEILERGWRRDSPSLSGLPTGRRSMVRARDGKSAAARRNP